MNWDKDRYTQELISACELLIEKADEIIGNIDNVQNIQIKIDILPMEIPLVEVSKNFISISNFIK